MVSVAGVTPLLYFTVEMRTMKILLLSSVLLLIVFLVCQAYTAFDIKTVFKPVDTTGYRQLSDSFTTERHLVKKLVPEVYTEVLYSAAGNYFLLRHPEGFIKLDAAGNELYRLDTMVGRNIAMGTQYAADSTGVYDFAATSPVKEAFTGMLDLTAARTDWKKEFGAHYQQAEAVIYGREYTDERYPVFIKENGKWRVVYIPTNAFLDDRMEGVEHQLNAFPIKHPPMYALQDTGITVVRVKKEYVYATAAYMPLLPTEFMTTMLYRIAPNGEEIALRANGKQKTGFSGERTSFLHWLQVPEAYSNKVTAGFLLYNFNVLNNEPNGVYVVKPR